VLLAAFSAHSIAFTTDMTTTAPSNQHILMDVLRVSSSQEGVAFKPYALPTPFQQPNAPGTMGEVELDEVKRRAFASGQRLRALLTE
jgi:hypothetical protein